MERILRCCLLGLVCVLSMTGAQAASPTVSITSPANGAIFSAPATITLAANAAVSGGSITRVDFYRGGTTLIGTATASPYTITWSGVAQGSYVLTARATSSAGSSTTSTAVNITVNTQPPLVSLTSPINGATYAEPATISLAANASDPDGTVQRVDFFSAASLIGSSTAAPFTTTLSGIGAGTYTLTAKATDNAGAQTTSAAVTVNVSAVNIPPLVAMTSPDNCGPFNSRFALSLAADAVDPDGTVNRVEFYQGSTLIGAVSNPNIYADIRNAYGMSWSPSAGTYTVTAKAYDNKGTATTSAPVTFAVIDPPTVSITAPTSGLTFSTASSVAITASAAAGAGASITKVDFYAGGGFVGSATTAPYTVTWRPTSAGNYSIYSTATESGGFSTNSASVLVTVVSAPPPTVSLTSPQSGASVFANQSVALAASASSSSSSISKVAFYAGSIFLATATSSPYTANWTPTAAGSYSITAQATDAFGASTVSSPTSITVTASPPPTIALTAPAAGAALIVNQSVALSASASGNGTAAIVKVSFYVGSTLVGTSTSPPYSVTWTPTTAGGYALTASATDSFGVSATSAPVNVTVLAGPPPAVNLTSPAANSTFSSSGTVALAATATPAPGGAAIVKVDFFQANALLGTATVAPYTTSWASPAAGTYAVSAVATDALGISATSGPVTITVINSPSPTVSLSSPKTGAIYAAPANITLTATAAAAAGASIAKVDFYQGSTFIGTASSAPYLYTWTGVVAGDYLLKAIATDTLGIQASSSVAAVSVGNLKIAITSPLNAAALSGTKTLVQGTIQAPLNSGVVVNGIAALVDAGNHFYAQISLQPGANTITATVTAATGQTLTNSITATSDGASPFVTIDITDSEGVSPLPVTYTLTNTGATNATVTFNGGPPSVLTPGQTAPSTASYQGVGTFFTTITATDGSGRSMTQTSVVVLDDPVQLDAKFKSVWNGMNNALILGDKATALNYLSAGASAIYGPVFDALMPSMAGIVLSFSAPQMGPVSSGLSEYVVTRSINGTTNVFFLYFVKDASGVWRLDSM